MSKRKGGSRRLPKGPSPLEELNRMVKQQDTLPVPPLPARLNKPGKLPPPPPGGVVPSQTPQRAGTKKQIIEGRLVPDPRQIEAFKRQTGSQKVTFVNIDGKTYLQAPINRNSQAWEANFERVVREQKAKGRVFAELIGENDEGAARAKFIGFGDVGIADIFIDVYGYQEVALVPGGPVNVPNDDTPIRELVFEPPAQPSEAASEFRTGTFYFGKGPLFSGRRQGIKGLDNP